jgi:hypothetical protein
MWQTPWTGSDIYHRALHLLVQWPSVNPISGVKEFVGSVVIGGK